MGGLLHVKTGSSLLSGVVLAKLIIVLGHERCGAVTAAMQGGEAPGNIRSVVDAIKPAV